MAENYLGDFPFPKFKEIIKDVPEEDNFRVCLDHLVKIIKYKDELENRMMEILDEIRNMTEDLAKLKDPKNKEVE